MHFKTFYWNLLAPFAALYAFFLLRFLILYLNQKRKYHLKLTLLSLCSFTMATISALMLAQTKEVNLHLFTFAGLANYTGYYIYYNLVSHRFGYLGLFSKMIEIVLASISALIFITLLVGLLGDTSWIYKDGLALPDNIFLAISIGKKQLSTIPQLISIFGTISVIMATLYLLVRFIKQRLVGYQRLVLWGVIASLLVKLNDFTLTTGLGTYLIPLGFIHYFFEIIYFHIQDNQEKDRP